MNNEMARRAAARKVRPIWPWIVVLPSAPETQTDSGLHLVASEDAVPAQAEVVGLPSIPPEASTALYVGATVFIKKYQALLYLVDKVEVMLVPHDAIVGLLVRDRRDRDQKLQEMVGKA